MRRSCARARRRESAPEAPGRRPDARQPDTQARRRKTMVTPTARRLAVGDLRADFPVSPSRACTALGVARSSCRCVSRRDDGALRAALIEVAQSRPRFGYRRVHVLLQRAGWHCNHKRLYRLYREERLAVRRRRRRKLAAGCRIVMAVPMRPHERWSMDGRHARERPHVSHVQSCRRWPP